MLRAVGITSTMSHLISTLSSRYINFFSSSDGTNYKQSKRVLAKVLDLRVSDVLWSSDVRSTQADIGLQLMRGEIIEIVNNRKSHQINLSYTKSRLQDFCIRFNLPSTGSNLVLATTLCRVAAGDDAQSILSPKTATLVSIDKQFFRKPSKATPKQESEI